MLRRRSSGVAKFSQHMLGKAIDFYIPGVPLEQLREAGLRAQRGGVGFYPTSGSPFVHLDTGNVRHWPRMPEAQLASVLAKGQLPDTPSPGRHASKARPALFARLFGGGRNEAEDAKTAADGARASPLASRAAAPEARTEKPAVVAAASEARVEKAAPRAVAAGQARQDGDLPGRIRGLEARRQADARLRVFADRRHAARAMKSHPQDRSAGASRPGGNDPGRVRSASVTDIINERGYWRGLPSAEQSTRRQAGSARARSLGATPTGRDRQRRSGDHGSVTPWPLTDRVASADPGALAYARAADSDRGARTLPSASARRVPRPSQRRKRPSRSSAADEPSVIGGATRGSPARAGRRSFQRSVDARHDREPERAELHEDYAATARRTSAISARICKSRRHGDDDVRRTIRISA